MNKELYNRKVKLPDTLKDHLEKSFNSVEGNANTEGYNRNQEIRNSGILSYQQLKRIKNWFDTHEADDKNPSYILNGGQRMSNWVTHVLNHWRSASKQSKQIRADSGMQNQFIKPHTKDQGQVNPQDRHEKGLNKYDVAVTEQIKKINKLIKDI